MPASDHDIISKIIARWGPVVGIPTKTNMRLPAGLTEQELLEAYAPKTDIPEEAPVATDLCKNGHDMTDPEVCYVDPSGIRRCRICRRQQNKETKARHKTLSLKGHTSLERHLEACVQREDFARTNAIMELQDQIEREPVSWRKAELRQQMEQLVGKEYATSVAPRQTAAPSRRAASR